MNATTNATPSDLERLTENFRSSATVEEGAAAFAQLVEFARKTEPVERSRVLRVEAVVDYIAPEGETQKAAVLLAKREMGFEPSPGAF